MTASPTRRAHASTPFWRFSAFIFIVLIVAGPRSVAAAAPEDLIRKGIDLRREDRDAEALLWFLQAYEIEKSPRALAQIGLAEQALGRWGAADRHLRTALETSDDPWIGKNRAAIDDALKIIGGHVGRLDVRGSPAAAEVRVDGELVGRLPLTVPLTVTAGGVVIELRASGYFPIVRAAVVSPGDLTRETFSLQSVSATSADDSSARRERGRPSSGEGSPSLSDRDSADLANTGSKPSSATHERSLRPAIVVSAAGLALVSLTAGIVEHVSWQQKVGSFENMPGCSVMLEARGGAGCQQLYDDGKRAKALAFVGYGLTAGLVATAAVVHLTEPLPESETKVACAVNPFEPGVGCVVRF